jgi:hypothetical protein
MKRDLWAALVASVVVLVAVIFGFAILGSPSSQRLIRSDLRTLRSLSELAHQINARWHAEGKTLPASLDQVANAAKQDPVSHRPFLYRPKGVNQYELCAEFAAPSPEVPPESTKDDWAHPKGNFCFHLDASQPVPQVPYYY